MNINNITNKNTLEYYIQFYTDIPTKSGVYYWFFWPFKGFYLEDKNFNLFVEKIKYFSSINLNLPESAKTGYKFSVEVRERGLDCEVLGLNNNKSTVLLAYLKESQTNREYFLNYLKNIILTKPFYIGKANNLQTRLLQHFKEQNSEILNHLSELKIEQTDVLIAYEVIESNLEDNINTIFEEIAQRILKPGLTKRPG
ncbi:GIY-YIG nuclease family protein [Flavobacterium tegetincola]|uniref:GIY-YIG nuclease family protein n=1 Tax=Flavobacterium tegetincola TaxID=150172 RepID=UPI0003FF977B|nr:GIY-YIG nuclease family protein [Flavobacterium tegetincola]